MNKQLPPTLRPAAMFAALNRQFVSMWLRRTSPYYANHSTMLVVCITILIALLSACGSAPRDRVREHFGNRTAAAINKIKDANDGKSQATPLKLPSDIRIERDIPYGNDTGHRLDVYIPPHANKAPIIFMVHGGAWTTGDKAAPAFINNKAKQWLPKGYLIVSINYRMSRNNPNPIQQADDVGRALAFVQANATTWGGDPTRILLLGHSAGAHLVSLVSADPRIVANQGGKPWLGTIALDSAAMDIVKIMQNKHFGFYDNVFGKDPEYWAAASPFHRLASAPVPMLMICSSQRKDSCPQANAFSSKAAKLGGRVSVHSIDLTHGEINNKLGLPGEYTNITNEFIKTLGLP